MAYLELTEASVSGITIMIFAEGTLLKPKSFFAHYNHKSYLPIGNCINLIEHWQQQGANIIFCTSRKGKRAVAIHELLMYYKFTGTRLYFRDKNQRYKDIVEQVKPDILIEDDCHSIGGKWQMCITHVEPQLKKQIKSIVVKEFKGIDDLPFHLSELNAMP